MVTFCLKQLTNVNISIFIIVTLFFLNGWILSRWQHGATCMDRSHVDFFSEGSQWRLLNCSNLSTLTISLARTSEILDRSERSPRSICKCANLIHSYTSCDPVSNSIAVESSCSDEATLLGGLQKVISYSLFFDQKYKADTGMAKLYFDGIVANLQLMKKLYPGWVMRIYSNVTLDEKMCDVICSDQHLYFCDIHQLPDIGNMSVINPRTWRMLLVGDPTVEKFAVRDLDSRLSQRERDAVREWELSQFAIHGMRDHPAHNTKIMAGMWGADNYKLCFEPAAQIRTNIISRATRQLEKIDDQIIISKEIYSKHRNKILTHDSYLCKSLQDSAPFPSKRHNDYEFVGKVVYESNLNPITRVQPCPELCRPVYGKDWTYC